MGWMRFNSLAGAAICGPTSGTGVFARCVGSELGGNRRDFRRAERFESTVFALLGAQRRCRIDWQLSALLRPRQWEKAFKQLDALSSTKATGLVPGPDGVMVPPSQLVVRLISDLPAEGKKAFQLFYDADAKSLLDQAQGSVESEKLSTVATRYLFTASGDTAADRWGDLCFEKGDFARAAAAWAEHFEPSSRYHHLAIAIIHQNCYRPGAGKSLGGIRRD